MHHSFFQSGKDFYGMIWIISDCKKEALYLMRRWMFQISGLALLTLGLLVHSPIAAAAAGHALSVVGAHSNVLLGPPIEG